jgi:hypothetical protein
MIEMELKRNAIYQKGTRMRMFLGYNGFFAYYKTISNRARIIGEARYKFEKWMEGAKEITGEEAISIIEGRRASNEQRS